MHSVPLNTLFIPPRSILPSRPYPHGGKNLLSAEPFQHPNLPQQQKVEKKGTGSTRYCSTPTESLVHPRVNNTTFVTALQLFVQMSGCSFLPDAKHPATPVKPILDRRWMRALACNCCYRFIPWSVRLRERVAGSFFVVATPGRRLQPLTDPGYITPRPRDRVVVVHGVIIPGAAKAVERIGPDARAGA